MSMFDQECYTRNSKLIVENPRLSILSNIVYKFMSCSLQMMVHISEKGMSEEHIFMGGYRNIAQLSASLDLLRLGYYAESCSILRNAFEMTNVLVCALEDPAFLEKWKNAKRRDYMPRGDLAPYNIRKKSSEILNIDASFQDKRYEMLCKISTHPDNEGIFFFNSDGPGDHVHHCNSQDCEFILEEIVYQSYLLIRGFSKLCLPDFPYFKEVKDSISYMENLKDFKNQNGMHFGFPPVEWE